MKKKIRCKSKAIARNAGFSGSKQSGSSVSSPISPELVKQAPSLLGGIRNLVPGIAGTVDIPDEEALFRQVSERGLQAIRPGFAGRGLLTSGAGLEAEQRFISDLSTQFGERAFDRSLSASQFEREGVLGQSSVLLDALRAILGQTTTGSSTSSGSSIGFNVGS